MSKTVSLLFLFGGLALLFFGYNEAHTVRSNVLQVFTGSPSDKAIWMIVAGAIAVVAGVIGLTNSSK
jgi:hypothetical protein